MYSQLKYETLHDFQLLEQESSDHPSSSNHPVTNVLHSPPSYTAVTEQPQTRQQENYRSTTIQPQSGYSQHSAEPVYNHREIPLTCQPQRIINTTAVRSEPAAKRPWKTGFCDCCANWSVCMCVTCCPMCYTCSLARRLEENCCLACCPGGLAIMRSNVRRWHNIEGSSMDDVCLTFWCRCCVLCQMGNELNAHKYGKVCCC